MIYYERSILPKSVFAGSFFITFADTLDLISLHFHGLRFIGGALLLLLFFDDHE